MTQADMEKAIAEVWALFKENSTQLKETRELFLETDRKIAQTQEQFKETRELFLETDRKIEKMGEKVDKVNDTVNKLTDRWSRFIECFVSPGIPKAFQERGIAIVGTSQRQKRTVEGKQMEIDILGVNTDCVLAVEVKSTLRPEYVTHFLEKLPNFKRFFPEYKDRVIYGAVAAIEIVQEADVFAARQGLWVITQRGDTVVIGNEQNFQPKTW